MSPKSFFRRVSRHSYLLISALVVVVTVLSACTGAVAPTGGEAAPSGDTQGAEPTTITVWGWPAADVAFESYRADFEAKYPDIKLDIQMMPTADVHNKLLASLAAGEGAPDVSMIEINQIDKFVSKGGLVNLLDDPYNAGHVRERHGPLQVGAGNHTRWPHGSLPVGHRPGDLLLSP